MNKSNSRNFTETKLNMILNSLSNCNIYVHHIWGLEDRPESIKKWVMQGGLHVKYNRAMFSTVMPLTDATASDIIDYYFANKHNEQINVVIAIPKQIDVNGITLPFSDNIESYNQIDVAKMNEAYINLFDLCRGIYGSNIPKEFVLGAVVINNDECDLELNSNFNIDNGKQIYQQKIISTINIGDTDSKEQIMQKITTKMEERNSNIGNRPICYDFDID